MSLPNYYGIFEIIWHYMLRTMVVLILAFLVVPILIILPLSFNTESFFSFTQGMLSLDPDAYSTKWYYSLFNDQKWELAFRNSFYYAFFATIFATALGTLAAVGLSSDKMPFKPFITAILISPMIVPLVIIASGMYFFYSSMGIIGEDSIVTENFGLIVAHTMLGTPFVVITVTATLVGFDQSLLRASSVLGANPLTTFYKITFPLIRPGIISGALFAFITSFDEVILIIFLASPNQRTIPRQMFSGLREQINPTILAASTLLILISFLLLFSIEMLRRKAQQKTKI